MAIESTANPGNGSTANEMGGALSGEKRVPLGAGLRFERYFTTSGVDPFDADRMGAARRRDRQREGRDGLRAEGRRGARSAGRRPRPTSSSRSTSAASSARRSARRSRAPAHRPRRRHDDRAGAASGGYFAADEDAAHLPRRAHAHPGPPDGLLQLAGLVQRRRRGEAAVLGLLHQLGRGHDGVDPRARQDRGHALQVRLGHRLEPLLAALVARSVWPAAAPPRARSPS